MDLETLAAIVFCFVAGCVVAFQLALALGAPWGAYAMGGAFPARFPPVLRFLAVVQAVVIGLLALVIASAAGLAAPALVETMPSLPWVVVAFSAISLGLNALSRSAGERRLWVPVAFVMLVTSLIVALSGN